MLLRSPKCVLLVQARFLPPNRVAGQMGPHRDWTEDHFVLDLVGADLLGAHHAEPSLACSQPYPAGGGEERILTESSANDETQGLRVRGSGGAELGVAGSAHLPRRVQEPPGFARAIARASHQ